ncbi:hypothetical protein EYW98_02000 [Escherichia coli]|uniref:hypothetical protein n=1 Tax=Escherichia sp. MOD1-EC7003 TaxID=2093900 RepID=UPI000CF7787B|nr:hypothetical protein [Escherichia sp. MOD1-EC7003]EGO8358316.1 hypothetical protein [Escherichia coli]EGO8375802.1 hypothetical protein [Escherichia coli]MCH0692960.1 hypothetical protein [Escherichia coli]
MKLIFKTDNFFFIKLVSVFSLLLMSTSLHAKNPCEGLNGDLPAAQLIPLKKNIARQLNSEMEQIVEVNKIEILSFDTLHEWSVVGVATGVSDDALLIYKGNITNTDYVALFAGAVSVDDDMIKWINQQAPGIPDSLAQCFAWGAAYGGVVIDN